MLEVESRQETAQNLASQLDCSEETLQQILNGHLPITPSIAYKLQQCWGISMTLLLDIQRDYDAHHQQNSEQGSAPEGQHLPRHF
ncbi:hypothetical protein DC3_00930 [Deinococcus cellulosilyticus NBRC 106333 = KACC 11606]|uniref:HTH cro/C1-type domain-containing protein n=2 Tax=Deinococcus cellulosilyticus TaxID=401558 RepID=A0A511MW16_DEIC1|nr:hypothetical protein DC3_00930 [Deinococcus cellulosilyticus NBRC 106333 = KACC 11606]